jgi:hypothetical protein
MNVKEAYMVHTVLEAKIEGSGRRTNTLECCMPMPLDKYFLCWKIFDGLPQGNGFNYSWWGKFMVSGETIEYELFTDYDPMDEYGYYNAKIDLEISGTIQLTPEVSNEIDGTTYYCEDEFLIEDLVTCVHDCISIAITESQNEN